MLLPAFERDMNLPFAIVIDRFGFYVESKGKFCTTQMSNVLVH